MATLAGSAANKFVFPVIAVKKTRLRIMNRLIDLNDMFKIIPSMNAFFINISPVFDGMYHLTPVSGGRRTGQYFKMGRFEIESF